MKLFKSLRPTPKIEIYFGVSVTKNGELLIYLLIQWPRNRNYNTFNVQTTVVDCKQKKKKKQVLCAASTRMKPNLNDDCTVCLINKIRYTPTRVR